MRMFAAARSTAAFVALLTTVACGAETPTEPDPVYELKSASFSGSIASGESKGFVFTVTNPGAVTVMITALSPVSTLTMGLGLGAWDAAALTCTAQLSTSSATVNVAFTGNPSGAGDYCVSIFDVGNIQATTDFQLSLTHY